MKATGTDMRDAWQHAKTFLEKPAETHLSLWIDSEYAKAGYTIVKLPYGENIDLLYALSWYDKVLLPNIDLKYAGFYSRQNKQSYNIREPLDRFFGFDGGYMYESELKKMVTEAVQKTVAAKIALGTDITNGLLASSLNTEVIGMAEKAFSMNETILDFSKKIVFHDYHISESAMVDIIDNPENIRNPNSILKRYVDDILKGHEEELTRLWFAHLTTQKLLDRLYAEEKAGNQDE